MYFKSVGFVDEQRACICVRETTKGENAWRRLMQKSMKRKYRF